MEIKELAALLNGNELYGEVTEELAKKAKESGLVIVFGASDDLMEFEGAICDEIGCYEGGTAYFNNKGLLTSECDEDNCPYFEEIKKTAKTIEACFDEEGYTFIYKTDIPHETFEIMERGEKYCRGIVFSMDSLK